MEACDTAHVGCVDAPLADCGRVQKGRRLNVPVTANAGQLQNLRLVLTRPQTANGGRSIADRSSACPRSSSVFRECHLPISEHELHAHSFNLNSETAFEMDLIMLSNHPIQVTGTTNPNPMHDGLPRLSMGNWLNTRNRSCMNSFLVSPQVVIHPLQSLDFNL